MARATLEGLDDGGVGCVAVHPKKNNVVGNGGGFQPKFTFTLILSSRLLMYFAKVLYILTVLHGIDKLKQ